MQEVELNYADKIIKVTFLDKNKNAIISKEDGYAICKIDYDPFGKIIKELYYDNIGNPMADSNGAFGIEYKYNTEGLLIEIICLGSDGLPHAGKNGFTINKLEHDDNGHTTRELYYDAEQNPIASDDGVYGIAYEYNNDGKLTYSVFLGANEKPQNNKDGYSIIRCEWNDYGDEIKRCYFDFSEKPVCCPEGFHCKETIINRDKKYSITNYFDENHNLTDKNGNCSTVIIKGKTKLLSDNQIVTRYINSSGKKAENESGYYEEKWLENDEALFIAKDRNGKKIINNKTSRHYFKELYTPLTMIVALPFYLIYLIWYKLKPIIKLFLSKKKSEAATISIIIVEELAESKMAKLLGVEKDDLILEYGSWSLFAESHTDTSSEFEEEYNQIGRQAKTILFSRKKEDGYIFFRYDFPPGIMGMTITDTLITSIQFEELAVGYKKWNGT